MKRLILLILLFTATTSIAIGQSKTEDIQKLIQLIGSDEMIDKYMNGMVKSFSKQFDHMQVGENDEKAEGEDMSKEVEGRQDHILKEAMSIYKKIRDEYMVDLYDKHFTHEEIRDLIAFYKSPTGQKFLEKGPEITQELIQVMMTELIPEIEKKMREKMEDKE